MPHAARPLRSCTLLSTSIAVLCAGTAVAEPKVRADLSLGSAPMVTPAYVGRYTYKDGVDDYPVSLRIGEGTRALHGSVAVAVMFPVGRVFRHGPQLRGDFLAGGVPGWKAGGAYGIDLVFGDLELGLSAGIVAGGATQTIGHVEGRALRAPDGTFVPVGNAIEADAWTLGFNAGLTAAYMFGDWGIVAGLEGATFAILEGWSASAKVDEQNSVTLGDIPDVPGMELSGAAFTLGVRYSH